MFQYYIIFLLTLSSVVYGEINLRQQDGHYCYDGDTCYVIVNESNTKIRLLELDTPEISKPKCEAENLRSRSTNYVNNLIENASTIEFKTDYKKGITGEVYLI